MLVITSYTHEECVIPKHTRFVRYQVVSKLVSHTVTPAARVKDRVARPARTRPQDIVIGARTKAVV